MFLNTQGIVDQSFFEDLVAKVVEMLSQSLPNEEVKMCVPTFLLSKNILVLLHLHQRSLNLKN